MSEESEFTLPEEIEKAIKARFSYLSPDPTFIDRLGRQLSAQAEQIAVPRRKIQAVIPPLAWGAIALILILFMIWGIKNLIPRIEPGRNSRSLPLPSGSSTPVIRPTQSESNEDVGNLPVPVGNPVPWSDEPITIINAAQIQELARWGQDTISSIAWAPDGNSFAVASANTIHFYETSTLREINSIYGGSSYYLGNSIYPITYSPDGTKLASGENKSVKIWDIASASLLMTLPDQANFITQLAFSPDGEILGTAAYEEPLKLWIVNTGQELRTLSGVKVINFAFSPDGSLLATASGDDKIIRLWDVASGQELCQLAGHTDYVYGVTFSPDGSRLASSSNDRTIKLWEVSTGNELNTLDTQAIASGMAFLPDGNTLISAGDGEPITVWEASSGQVLRTIGESGQSEYISLSPDGKTVIRYPGWQGKAIRLYEIASGEELGRLDWQTYIVTSLGFSPDGNIVAVGEESGGIKLLDAHNGRVLRALSGHTKQVETVKDVESLAFSPDGTMLASGAMDETTRVWDVNSGEELATLDGVKEFGWGGGIPSVAFSPDGKFLAFAGPIGQVKVWDVINRAELRTLGGQTGEAYADAVGAVTFSPDGKILAAGYESGSITLWDIFSGQAIRTMSYTRNYSSIEFPPGVSSLEFAPDGKMLSSGYFDAYIVFWDIANGSELRRFSLPWEDEITRLDFSPDGSILAIGSGMESTVLMDAANGEQLIDLKTAANGLAFSPDGKVLISGAFDGAIHLWGMAPHGASQQEPTTMLPNAENTLVQVSTPQQNLEELNIDKILLPALLTGPNIQPGDWSPDGSYFYYSQQGAVGEPGPDLAAVTINFLDARTGARCEGVQEIATINPDWGYPEGVSPNERARWLNDNRLLYISPNGEIMAITPSNESMDNWTASVPDTIIAHTYSLKSDGSQIVLKGQQAYWLFTPATQQSVKLDIPLPQEGMITSIGWLPGEDQLYSARIEERGGLWIVIEAIDPVTGAAAPLYEVQASSQLYNIEPKIASVEWIDKDLVLVHDTQTGGQLVDLSSQPAQVMNLFPDLFGFEKPDMWSIMASGVMGGNGRKDYHLILQTMMTAEDKYYIYHPESGVVDQYSLDTPLLVVFPNGEGGIAQSYTNPPSNNVFKVIMVDRSTKPYDLVVAGHATVQNSWSFATLLPGAQRVMFSSVKGISIVDLMSGETLQFWGLDDRGNYQDFYPMLSPDGKTVVGIARQQSSDPGVLSSTQTVYWLRIEP